MYLTIFLYGQERFDIMFQKIHTGLSKNEEGVLVYFFYTRDSMACEIAGQKYLLYAETDVLDDGNQKVIFTSFPATARKEEDYTGIIDIKDKRLPLALQQQIANYILEASQSLDAICKFDSHWDPIKGKP